MDKVNHKQHADGTQHSLSKASYSLSSKVACKLKEANLIASAFSEIVPSNW